MTNSNNKRAVAVKTKVSAGTDGGITAGDRPALALVSNHNETVAVKTRVHAGDPQSGLPTGQKH